MLVRRVQHLVRLGLMAIATTALSIAPVAEGADAKRQTIDLSGRGWRLWLDSDAPWENDKLHLDVPRLPDLPVHPPTNGWDTLQSAGVAVSVPSTVEEHYWHETRDYRGVSWWSRTFELPEGATRRLRRVVLQFDSVRLRAEVFVNRTLVGYDAVGNTPFEIDVTSYVKPGVNELAVRVTDPSGNFTWVDYDAHRWGDQTIPASHGFGGITGPVRLQLLAPVYIKDIYVRNKPTITDVDVTFTTRNTIDADAITPAKIQIIDAAGVDIVAQHFIRMEQWRPGEWSHTFTLSAPQAKPWSLDKPKLYTCRVTLGDYDVAEARFGFRWFDLVGVGEDARLRLNNERIVLRSAISWGFWPRNGIAPTRELARREILAAKRLGLNMLNYHRCISHPVALDLADELGLLVYEEPGGYTARSGDDRCHAFAREKLLRMVRRDRNHPAVIIYNMINEEQTPPTDRHRRDMQDAHRLDPARLITYTSGWAKAGVDDPVKLHMRPNDDTLYMRGWFDYHHATSPGVYPDRYYNGPSDYWLHTDNRGEIVFWGEEGAIAAPPPFEKILAEIIRGADGWDGPAYEQRYEVLAEYLELKGMDAAFPSLDRLCRSMGDVAYEYQGRLIENARIGNVADGYVINGWDDQPLENHSGIVDGWRHFKGNPQIIAHYNQPLYLAVKLRTRVAALPATLTADVHVVNEVNRSGPHELHVELETADGERRTLLREDVTLTGGETFGELLKAGIVVDIKERARRCKVIATLTERATDKGDGVVVARGRDDAYLVDWRSMKLPTGGARLGSAGPAARFLSSEKSLDLPALSEANAPTSANPAYILVEGAPFDRVPVPASAFSHGKSRPGLTGEYHRGQRFDEQLLKRVDEMIDFTFASDGPSPAVGRENFCVRWTGALTVPTDGPYHLATNSDDGVRVWLDGKLVIDAWSYHPTQLDTSEPLSLVAGRPYPLRIEYFQGGGDGGIQLLWTTPTQRAAGEGLARDLLARVRDHGATALVLGATDEWATLLADAGAIRYTGRLTHGRWWLGGSYFSRAHPILEDLPAPGGLNWEYQELIHYDARRYGLLMEGEQAVIGCLTGHEVPVATALGIVELGRGRLVFSTLDLRALDTDRSAAAVVRKLVCNLVRFAGVRPD